MDIVLNHAGYPTMLDASEYGIDSFRCDTTKHVDLRAWTAFENYASLALEGWKAENLDKVLDVSSVF